MCIAVQTLKQFKLKRSRIRTESLEHHVLVWSTSVERLTMTSRLNQQRLQIQIKVQNIPYRTVQIASRTCACSMLACLTLLSVTVWLAFPCLAGTFCAAAGATGAGDCKLRASLSLRLSITCSIPPASGDAELSSHATDPAPSDAPASMCLARCHEACTEKISGPCHT